MISGYYQSFSMHRMMILDLLVLFMDLECTVNFIICIQYCSMLDFIVCISATHSERTCGGHKIHLAQSVVLSYLILNLHLNGHETLGKNNVRDISEGG